LKTMRPPRASATSSGPCSPCLDQPADTSPTYP
jgi:hypothetical protein